MATATTEKPVKKPRGKKTKPEGNYGVVHDSRELCEADTVFTPGNANQFKVYRVVRHGKDGSETSKFVWARSINEAGFLALVKPNLRDSDTNPAGVYGISPADGGQRGNTKKLTVSDIPTIRSLLRLLENGEMKESPDDDRWALICRSARHWVPFLRTANRLPLPEKLVDDPLAALFG